MDDLLPDGRPSARHLAELGMTLPEIAAELEMSEHQASELMGPVTDAQLRRSEHTLVARGIGMAGHLPHVQAQQSVLQAYRPETYGRQAAPAGGVLRVIVDRGYTLRAGVTLDHESLPAIAPSTSD